MSRSISYTARKLSSMILSIRGQRVILDADLARIYGVQTRAVNQAVKRNPERFPRDFVIELSREEVLRISQTVTSLRKLKYSKRVFAFSEHGALMAASMLNSPLALKMSVFIIRAFVKMREDQLSNVVILRRLAEIDKTLLTHDEALRDIYEKLLPLLEPAPDQEKREIGFHMREDEAPYHVRKPRRDRA